MRVNKRRMKIHRADWLPDGTLVPRCRTKSTRTPIIAEEIKFANCDKCKRAKRSGAVLPGEI